MWDNSPGSSRRTNSVTCITHCPSPHPTFGSNILNGDKCWADSELPGRRAKGRWISPIIHALAGRDKKECPARNGEQPAHLARAMASIFHCHVGVTPCGRLQGFSKGPAISPVRWGAFIPKGRTMKVKPPPGWLGFALTPPDCGGPPRTMTPAQAGKAARTER
jgi:hypothetical protein